MNHFQWEILYVLHKSIIDFNNDVLPSQLYTIELRLRLFISRSLSMNRVMREHAN